MPEKPTYPMFDPSQLQILPLDQREHDMDRSEIKNVEQNDKWLDKAKQIKNLDILSQAIYNARKKYKPVILFMGAHVIKVGMSKYIIEWIKNNWITHIGTNGAGVIHDFELALIGATTESVPKYISEGQFGLWKETGELNTIVKKQLDKGMGIGQAVGETLYRETFPYKDISIMAHAYEYGVPYTSHIGIGYDIIHEHPNFSGAVMGEASHRDFLIFVKAVQDLEGGVFLNFGSAVMGPEVYLKALAMARNVAKQEGKTICHFHTAVFDMQILPEDYHTTPGKDHPLYYYRPWKTILVRTVADGGNSYYFNGMHEELIPCLHQLLAASF